MTSNRKIPGIETWIPNLIELTIGKYNLIVTIINKKLRCVFLRIVTSLLIKY